MNKTATALIVILLLSSVLVIVSEPISAQNSSIIRIKADGTVTGTDKIMSHGLVYTVTGNLYASIGQNEAFIFIEKDNIVLNGAGYTIQGIGVGSAIYMLKSQNVTVENFTIRGFNRGIDFGIVENWPSDTSYLNQPSAFNNQIRNNKIEAATSIDNNRTRDAGWCIYLNDATQTMISGNSFVCHNPIGGVYLGNSTRDTSIIDNDFAGGGIYSLKSNQTTAKGNMIDGKPLIYLDGESSRVIEEAGLVYLFNCKDIVVKNVAPTYAYTVTIQLVNTTKSKISNSMGHIILDNSSYNSIHDNQLNSITLDASSHNQVFANTITGFSVCIKLYGESSFNKIYSNLLLDTIYSVDAKKMQEGGNTIAIQIGDIDLGNAIDNDIRDNRIINHDCGFEFFLSQNNTLTANIVENCTVGIRLGKAHKNTITENNLTSCKYAISIYAGSSNNSFYYNNFINNQIQCVEIHQQTFLSDKETYSVGNTWDNGKAGNYWDTYTGKDVNGDGIGDSPYQVFENMTDHYPLMKPFETSNTNNPTPTYNPIITQPPLNEAPERQLSRETKILIIAACIIFGVVGSLLAYFRRLIFR